MNKYKVRVKLQTDWKEELAENDEALERALKRQYEDKLITFEYEKISDTDNLNLMITDIDEELRVYFTCNGEKYLIYSEVEEQFDFYEDVQVIEKLYDDGNYYEVEKIDSWHLGWNVRDELDAFESVADMVDCFKSDINRIEFSFLESVLIGELLKKDSKLITENAEEN